MEKPSFTKFSRKCRAHHIAVIPDVGHICYCDISNSKEEYPICNKYNCPRTNSFI